LVFGAYCSSGALPDQFWVGKFSCAGSDFCGNGDGADNREAPGEIGDRIVQIATTGSDFDADGLRAGLRRGFGDG